MTDDDDDEGRRLQHLRQGTLREHGGLPAEHVNASDTVANCDGRPERTLVPVLARRRQRQELTGGR